MLYKAPVLRSQWHHRAGILGVSTIIVFYNILFAFSFLPLTEGWFTAYAHQILEGRMPYRDFYLYLTPFYPMAIAAIVGVFGNSFFVLRVIGVFIIVAIAILLYLILTKRFSPSSSMVASIAACIYYQSGVAHIPYDFTQVLTLFTLAATWMLVEAETELQSLNIEYLSWRSLVIRQMFLVGTFASLAFLTKQSNGAFIVIAVFLNCLYLVIPLKKWGWKLFISFSLGIMMPIMIMFIWLYQANAISAFWEQIFSGALSSKGSLGVVLFAWLKGLLTPVYWEQMITVGKLSISLIVLSLIITKALRFTKKAFFDGFPKLILLVSFAFLCIMAIVTSFFDSLFFANQLREFGLQSSNYIIPVATSLSAMLLVLGGISCFIPLVKKIFSPQIIILGIMSVGMIWGNGTSAGLSEIGVFTMFALFLAWMIEFHLFRYVGHTIALLLIIVFIFTFSSKKFESPYAWWGITEPSVHEANYLSRTPITQGIRMSHTTARNIDELADALDKGSHKGDIFAFPNIPFVYLIVNKYPNSKVLIPWFDFLPDAPAISESERLLNSPPATIVDLKLPSSSWEAHERLFRKGQPLGQRNIQVAIKRLTEQNNLYKLYFSREVSPGCILEVWHKVDVYGRY